MQTETIPINHPDTIQKALYVLNTGGVIAFPTDTIYGLAASASNSTAIENLFEIKGRDQTKAIAVLIGNLSQFEQVGYLSITTSREQNNNALNLARHFWPGALTLVVPRHPDLPDILSPHPTIGIRMPDHPLLQTMLETTGPLATTSANLSGGPNPVSARQVLEQLNGRINLLLDGGQTPGPIASTVVDCTHTPPIVLRQGAVTFTSLKGILPNLLSSPQ
jgi:L-threonylcarbamoyladenylate synthase